MAFTESDHSIEQEPNVLSDEEIIKGLATRLLERVKVFEDTPTLESSLTGNTETVGVDANQDQQKPSLLNTISGLKFELNVISKSPIGQLTKGNYSSLEGFMNFLTRNGENWSTDQLKLQDIKRRSIQRN